jgi:ADP-heptose:LPS heptosyltransferase
MNFPGLDFTWQSTHHAAHKLGIIRTWDLPQCQQALHSQAKVLVVANTALGDTILCTPLLKALSNHLGAQRVGFLVKKPYRALYQHAPWIESVYSTPGKYRGLNKLRQTLAHKNYRIALIANCTEPDLIPWLYWCGIKGFLRYRTRWSRFPQWFANLHAMRPPGHPEYATGHAITNNLAMARSLGIAAEDETIELHPHEKNPYPITAPYFIIHPGASRPSKCWPTARWIHLAQRILHARPWRAVITGLQSEMHLTAPIAAALGQRALDLSGRLSLPQLTTLIAQAQLFLSGDTGPYHIAVATGCPTLTLFAPTDRGSSTEACGPWAVDLRYHRVLQTKQFGDPIDTISLDALWHQAQDLLDALAQKP